MDALNTKQQLSFGTALEALKNGRQIAREGWNGKGMFVYLNSGNTHTSFPIAENGPTLIEGIRQNLFVLGDADTVIRLPNINMKAATGSTVTGWLASQTDLLAEDWNILN